MVSIRGIKMTFDLRKKSTELIDRLHTANINTISHNTLRSACAELISNTNNTKIIIDYLLATGLIVPTNYYEQKPDYTINYERNEQLKDPEFNWLKPDEPIQETQEGA